MRRRPELTPALCPDSAFGCRSPSHRLTWTSGPVPRHNGRDALPDRAEVPAQISATVPAVWDTAARVPRTRYSDALTWRDNGLMGSFHFDGVAVTLLRDGTSEVVSSREGPVRVDGYTVGVVPLMDRPPPHRGELHPDGDEFLYLVSGRVEVVLDDGDLGRVGAETRHEIAPGGAFIVPRGVWHRLEVLEPAHLVHVTPGPGSGHRPL